MSKNTERGMGYQAGPVADGRPDDAKPRLASERSAAPSPQTEDGERTVKRGARSEIGQVTLLGVPAPVVDTEKVTAPGRDVHLPVEARRVAAPRPITGDSGPPPSAARRRTPPQPARTVIDQAASPTMRIKTPIAITPGSGSASARAADEARGALPVGRREPDSTTVVDEAEASVGGSVALGIGLSVALALIVVGVVRFGPHVRAGQPITIKRFEGRPDPRLDRPAVVSPGARPDPGLPERVTGVTPSGADGTARAAAAPSPGIGVEAAAPAGDPDAMGPPPSSLPSSLPSPSPSATTAGQAARGLAPDAVGTTPDEELDATQASRNAAGDKNARRTIARPRPLTSFGDRGSPPAVAKRAPGPAARNDVRPPVPGGDQGWPPRGGGATPASRTPPPFQPSGAPVRPPTGKADDAKLPYDPDSPLPPAAE